MDNLIEHLQHNFLLPFAVAVCISEGVDKICKSARVTAHEDFFDDFRNKIIFRLVASYHRFRRYTQTDIPIDAVAMLAFLDNEITDCVGQFRAEVRRNEWFIIGTGRNHMTKTLREL